MQPQAAIEMAREQLAAEGVLSLYGFYAALEEYLSLSVQVAVRAPNSLIRALAFADSRLGKRTLQRVRIEHDAPELVRVVYRLRCDLEGVEPTELAHAGPSKVEYAQSSAAKRD